MEPISLQLMDPNFKPIHVRAYTVPRSVEQQLRHSKEIVRLVDIGVLEEDYSKTEQKELLLISVGTIIILLLKHRMSPISYSKYWGG
jgi:hypothetical protein